MSVEVFNFNTIRDEKLTREKRRGALKEAFDGVSQLIVNTGKYPKAKAAMDIVVGLVDPDVHFNNGRVLQLPSTQDEPALSRAVDAATYKAELAKNEYLSQKFPELFFLFQQLDLALRSNLDDQVIRPLLKGLVFVGGDINAFITNGKTGELRQSHKLERTHDRLTEADFFALRDKLFRTYVFPQSGKIRVVWEISMVTINGHNHDFTDLVEVIADPIDPELLDMYLKLALANGMILKSNTRLELFELLCESGKIRTVARMPKELVEEKNYDFSKLRQTPKPEELQAIGRSIISNAPVHVA